MTARNVKILEYLIPILLGIALVAMIFLTSCTFLPGEVASGIESLHTGNILICEDYVKFVVGGYSGEAQADKLKLIQRHLELSKELDAYARKYGKGD